MNPVSGEQYIKYLAFSKGKNTTISVLYYPPDADQGFPESSIIIDPTFDMAADNPSYLLSVETKVTSIALADMTGSDGKELFLYAFANGKVYRSDDTTFVDIAAGMSMEGFTPGNKTVFSFVPGGVWIGRGSVVQLFEYAGDSLNPAATVQPFVVVGTINSIYAVDRNVVYVSTTGANQNAVVQRIDVPTLKSTVVLNASVDILKVEGFTVYYYDKVTNTVGVASPSCRNAGQNPASGCSTCLPGDFGPAPDCLTIETCSWNSDCGNDACGRQFDDDSRKVCCPTGHVNAFPPVFGLDWCSNYDDGQKCRHDVQCKSGVCLNNICGKGKVDPVTTCSWDYECENHHCGREGNVDKKVCCKNGEHCTRTGFDWCSGYGLGEPCEYSCQCNSGNCESNICLCSETAMGTSGWKLCITDAFFAKIGGDDIFIVKFIANEQIDVEESILGFPFGGVYNSEMKTKKIGGNTYVNYIDFELLKQNRSDATRVTVYARAPSNAGYPQGQSLPFPVDPNVVIPENQLPAWVLPIPA